MPPPTADRIGIVAVGPDVTVSLDEHVVETIPGRWLRDHGDGPASVDPRSGQRVVDTFAIAPDVAPVRVDREGGSAVIEWTDGAATTHDLVKLMSVALERRHPGPAPDRTFSIDPQVRPWTTPAEPGLLNAEVIDDDAGWKVTLERLRRDGWVMLEGAPPGPAPLERLASRLGYVRRTLFGDIWDMRPGATEHLDSAYDTTALDVHTDGSYSHDGPGVIVFSQQHRTGTGGDSVLVDGYAAAADLAVEDPDAADLLTRFAFGAHYLEPGVHLQADRPVLRVDPAGVLRQVTFNNYDRSPVLPAPGWVDPVLDAYRAFHDVVADPARRLRLEWAPGRMLLLDNWRLLHGRTAYTGGRHFLGMYTNREDLESSWRLAGVA